MNISILIYSLKKLKIKKKKKNYFFSSFFIFSSFNITEQCTNFYVNIFGKK